MFLAGKIIQKAVSGVPSWDAAATLNPSDKSGYAAVLSNGNLTLTASGATVGIRATTGKTTGTFVFEITLVTLSLSRAIGIVGLDATLSSYAGIDAYGIGWLSNGVVYQAGTVVASPGVHAVNDIIGLVVNLDTRQIKFYKNGTLVATVTYTAITGPIYPHLWIYDGGVMTANFGATAFAYTYN